MYDMRDIREVLIHSANFKFSFMKVKSLLAYKIFLYVILTANRKKLCNSNELLLEFESFADLASKLKLFYGASKEHGRTSINAALKYLEEASIIMSISTKPTNEEIKILELKKKPYLFLYFDIAELRDGYELEFFDNNYRYKIFERYFLPQITALNEIIHRHNISLIAYQLALYLIFQLEPSHFEDTFETEDGELMGYHEFVVTTYSEFSEYFSTFVGFHELYKPESMEGDEDLQEISYKLVPESTVSDSLDLLKNIGFIHLEFDNPNNHLEFEGVGYPDRDHLFITLPLVLPQ
ncbi:hypothetical protein Q4493_15395 [Colwellia sp. 1_MG-2023]|uniref:hypothetical protein n=1 Tax=Colwellia sp. 1_MG-2023 TaxID=3062649 RepID=UPI0026E276EC|nr:hypothetical protein [Colwellia sp. 1_MG-2023]MDO6447155.1 hypothetical protein [Colwellia sp. 1_MG-2023]